MTKTEVVRLIEETGIVAIVRGTRPEEIVKIAEALYAGGIRAIEVTCNTVGYLGMIEALVTVMKGRMAVGAGTVLTPSAAQAVIDAGAEFILAPNLDADVIKVANQYGKIAVPGVTTPTEMVQAYKLGAEIVKLFPAGALGPRYLKEVLGPLNHMKFMPVGGINAQNIPDFLKAGAFAFGIGSELVDKEAIAQQNYALITEKARQFMQLFKDNK
ncbi:bifunctional 4-hydroxy-2-oxoglutarate aldolase/2-dehydro-3-deoxy-phosphogluconate aldolase [Sporolituus thermophilus]|uniref:2-dehydro-3-deoxyphosphogluconate aldolase / (4S)-4-hydroxy-2-oxoglutarate aldolase n=1 Tax=Sporolituus thermophilus DSM 23256 TaxID=1123285 RepID=A0A1G7MGF6_9FIRM|nr:bifunctional 4-hydroxy-2-oxoglutarate aldolase/2-dehydro-3-deoxy-phosphogluconate aldolase [Sporolituus thermophilus]SDF60781.1 2-dehydro-3-deoxyphosphogluconate aldolase / (4S)-4-hydroxy-2-oxoglutarate aldolase [Sporolituus thermophilus DSM 23256]